MQHVVTRMGKREMSMVLTYDLDLFLMQVALITFL